MEGNACTQNNHMCLALISKSHSYFFALLFLVGRCSKQINVEILLVMVAENLIKYIGVMVLLQEASNYASF